MQTWSCLFIQIWLTMKSQQKLRQMKMPLSHSCRHFLPSLKTLAFVHRLCNKEIYAFLSSLLCNSIWQVSSKDISLPLTLQSRGMRISPVSWKKKHSFWGVWKEKMYSLGDWSWSIRSGFRISRDKKGSSCVGFFFFFFFCLFVFSGIFLNIMDLERCT